MQAIGMYSNKDYNELTLEKINNHYHDNITHKNKELLVHNVKIEKNQGANKFLDFFIRLKSGESL